MPLADIAAAAGVMGGALLAYAFLVEPRWLETRRVDVALAGWPRELDGLTVAHLSDLHLGAFGSANLVRRALAIVDAARPDLVALTGDYTVRGRKPAAALSAIADLGTRPAYAILGNHDYKAGEAVADRIAAGLANLGLTVLRNETATCFTARGPLLITGLDDSRFRRADLAGTLASLPDDGRPRLLLVHSPEAVRCLPPNACDLVLAGHTHGGQVRIPPFTSLWVRLAYSRFVAGAYQHRGVVVYVNRGLASVGLPVRFLRRPEVTLLTLRRAR